MNDNKSESRAFGSKRAAGVSHKHKAKTIGVPAKAVSYENRYKRKLNMLEPGSRMLLIAAVLFVLGLVCRMYSWTPGMQILFACAAIIILALIVLVAIELHQDRVLNEIAEEELRQQPDGRK